MCNSLYINFRLSLETIDEKCEYLYNIYEFLVL